MPTQKIFKQRVRARMSKTGESYAAARRQLIRKAGDTEPAVAEPAAVPTPALEAAAPPSTRNEIGSADLAVSEEAMIRATGRGHADWFAMLDAWGATDQGHTAIARWLRESNGVPGWWAQSITVSYERARGMRGRYQQRDGYSVSATKTVAVPPETALAAFTDAATRGRWLPDAPMRRRPTRAALTARFDWSEPVSRVVVTIVPKGDGKSTVAVTHEQIQEPEIAERLKSAWRDRLGALKAVLERG
jgi:uncharacterized protein YndB with AHSA1/START domain